MEAGGRDRELKRVIGRWGSFCMGFADVGADVYIALGIVALYAGHASPFALALAAVTYTCTGLCYAELASTYPVAGGAQYYSLKAFGKLHGFVSGWGLMLDYTINVALFSLASVGYLGFLVKAVVGSDLLLTSPNYALSAVGLIVALAALNFVGIKWSSNLNIIFVTLNLVTLAFLIIVGLPQAFLGGGLQEWVPKIGSIGFDPSWKDFLYATSLAMVSYIGIESISQAAEETRSPSRVIPSATKAAIVVVVGVSLVMSLLSVTLLTPDEVAGHSQGPMVAIASRIPVISPILILWVALMGFWVCYVSTNTGVIGVSRVTFSMGRLTLLPRSFAKVHPRFRTPYITILLFSAIAMMIIAANMFASGVEILSLVASLYNFGALVAYMYVNLSLIMLRNSDPTPRAWRVPFSFTFPRKGGSFEVPIIPLIGFLSSAVVWVIVVGTHEWGRVVGSLWFAIGIGIYLAYRRRGKGRTSS